MSATASYAAGSGTNNSLNLNMGGNAYKTATEEFTRGVSVKTITGT